MKRGFVFVLLVLSGVVAGASGAGAQQAPVVWVSGTTGMSVAFTCFDADPATTPGSVTFERSDPGPLTITFHISGGPTDLNSDPTTGADHTLSFNNLQGSATVTVNPAFDAQDAIVTIVDGQGYAVGDPASRTIPVTRSEPQCTPSTSTETANTLSRTGVRSTTGPLALVGITSVALGSLLLVLSSRRKASGVR